MHQWKIRHYTITPNIHGLKTPPTARQFETKTTHATTNTLFADFWFVFGKNLIFLVVWFYKHSTNPIQSYTTLGTSQWKRLVLILPKKVKWSQIHTHLHTHPVIISTKYLCSHSFGSVSGCLSISLSLSYICLCSTETNFSTIFFFFFYRVSFFIWNFLNSFVCFSLW